MRGHGGVVEDLSKRHDAGGGACTLPIGADATFNELKERSVFRRKASIMTACGGSYKLLAKDTQDKASWVPEGQEIPMQDGMNDFNTIYSESTKLASIIKLEKQFARDNHFDIQDYLVDRLSKTFARAEDDAFINGSGTDSPYGILGSSNGAETGVKTDSLSYDDVIKLYFSLDPEYRTEGTWLMNDETAYTLRTMKDDAGNYLWRDSDDTILGKPVCISEYMPDAESGKSPIAFGDFSYYWIADRQGRSFKRLNELYAANGQVGFLASQRVDGKMILPEAVKVLVQKAS